MQQGKIAVQTENIFPIIKKFLYSDHEIFLRELIANAIDATTKLKTYSSRGQFAEELGDLKIEILLDPAAKTLTIRDRGIGLTAEEADKYLNQIAFSSAAEFLETHKDASIIGHFGLGFYSAFMVAEKVEVVSRSFQPNSEGVKWSCDGSPEYQIEPFSKDFRGTDIILHIAADSEEFLGEDRIQVLLDKYCRFLPVPIVFGKKKEWQSEGEDGEKSVDTEIDNQINDTDPIWKKQPAELSAADYRQFYRKLYPAGPEPEFWIHLNIDYPFNLTGVLYFPKVAAGAMELQKNKIQLYSNQVFVTDDVREIVPEWLTLLHGVIDSPDIPLNVSRSSLQSDSNVKKITGYITRKVADKLGELFRADRADFERKWADLGLFVKFGRIQDEKFDERAADFTLLKTTDGKFFTLPEFKEKIKAEQTDKHGKIVGIYSNDAERDDALIRAAKTRGYEVLLMDNAFLDNHFIQHVEFKGGASDFVFVRVDSATMDDLVQKDLVIESVLSEKEAESVKKVFTSFITEKGARVEMKALSPDEQPVQIVRSEFMRRFRDMQQMQSSNPILAEFDTFEVIVNSNHPLVAQKMLAADADDESKKVLAGHLYDLALLNHGLLKGEKLTAFVAKSLDFLK